MPIPFYRYDYLLMSDLERNPYPMFSSESAVWDEKWHQRMLLIALERYADVLQKKREHIPREPYR